MGKNVHRPLDEGNRHYDEIAVIKAELTIADAD